MDRERPWSDLPQGIIEIIVNKLHFVDQVRAPAVCKTWRDCKDYVRCSDTLPWVISIQYAFDSESFMFKLIDPYSTQVIKVSEFINISKWIYIVDPNRRARPLASKNGWLLIGGHKSKILLYNPFTDDYIHSVFPQVECKYGIKATRDVDPTFPNWELFMGATPTNSGHIRIDTYTNSGLTWWSQVHIGEQEQLYSMLYMKGNIYCLSYGGILQTYRVEDGEWDFLTKRLKKMAVTTRFVQTLLLLMAVCLSAYIVGPPLYWHLMESSNKPSCSSCNCHCDYFSIPQGLSNASLADCVKHDPEVSEDTQKNFVELLSEELKLRETEAIENQRRADMALLEAKKKTSQFQKEADKCNSGMETCEEAREKSEAALLNQKQLTAMWELRARHRGWKGDSVSQSQANSNAQDF